LKRIRAINEKMNEGSWRLTAHGEGPIELELKTGPSFVLDRNNQWYILPMDKENKAIAGTDYAWVLLADPDSPDHSWLIKADGEIQLTHDQKSIIVQVNAETYELIAYESRPQADSFGKRFQLEFEHGEKLAHTLASLYWGTMLPSVIERTRALNYPISEGYVLSTLQSKYSGTYPDVDHEFQIKGRMSWGNELDYNVVRRMTSCKSS